MHCPPLQPSHAIQDCTSSRRNGSGTLELSPEAAPTSGRKALRGCWRASYMGFYTHTGAFDDHRGLCRHRTETALSRGMYSAQICHHMYRKGNKCKGFTKSLNFWRTVRQKPLSMVTDVTLLVLKPLAPGVKAYTAHPLIILRARKPHMQLGKVSTAQGCVARGMSPAIAPSHPDVHAGQHVTCQGWAL